MIRRRTLFVIPNLAGGGAQRVLTRLLRKLDRDRFEPAVAVFESGGPFQREIPDDVRLIDCGRGHGSGVRWRWFRRFVNAIRDFEPDLVVGFLWFANGVSVVARTVARSSAALMLAERATLDRSGEPWLDETLRRLFVRLLYRRADVLLGNSQALTIQLARRAGVARERVRFVPNPVDIERIAELSRVPDSGGEEPAPGALPLVVGMGRLVRQKGFDLAIRALAVEGPRFRLRILGEGPERERLRELAEKLGVGDRLELCGYRENPFPLLREAAIFVLPSRYEGFPNALLEAMALGRASVATDCPTGPGEMVESGRSGLLVPSDDAAALAVAIHGLLLDPGAREALGRAAAVRARDFDERVIVGEFERLFEEALALRDGRVRA